MRDLLLKTQVIIQQLSAACAPLQHGLQHQDYDMPYSRAHVILLKAEQDLHELNEHYPFSAPGGEPSSKTGLQRLDDDDIPEFTESEALLLVGALNGVRCTPATLPRNIAWDIASGGATRYSVDGPAFQARIDALSKVQAQAVIDAAALFWRGESHKSDEETYAVLYRVGLVKQESRAVPRHRHNDTRR